MASTVGPNRALRDQYNVVRRQVEQLSNEYNAFVATLTPPIADPNAALLTVQRLETRAGELKVQADSIKAQNTNNPEIFDPELNAQLDTLDANIVSIQSGLAGARQTINSVRLQQQQNPQPPGGDSAGEITGQAQAANAEGADTQSPPTGPLVLDDNGRVVNASASTAPSNASVVEPDADTGTNAPTRRITQTQSTPPSGPNETAPQAAQTRGEGAAPEDKTNITRTTIDNLFRDTAYDTPQQNVLSKFASYTYSVSLYIMSPSDYRSMIRQKKRNLAGWQLLIQSGGAPTSSGQTTAFDPQELAQQADGYSPTGDLKSLGRSQFFPLDFYIDDLRVVSRITGKGVQGAHNVTEMRFKIIEPNGISFIDRLIAATANYASGQQVQSYASQNYLMVIRFYGYDQNGNLITNNGENATQGLSDRNSITEKFIPFRFTAIKFKVANRLVEYDCECAVPQNDINTGQARGVIPFNVEFTGTKLKDILVGNQNGGTVNQTGTTEGRQAQISQQADVRRVDNSIETQAAVQATGAPQTWAQRSAAAAAVVNTARREQLGLANEAGNAPVEAGTSPTQSTAPPKATSAPSQNVAKGLCEALNQFQAQRVQDGIYEHKDDYQIIIRDPINSASIRPPGELNKKYLPMTITDNAAQKLLGSKQRSDTNSKNINAFAGMSIVQFIDLVTRSSTYIYDQQTKIIEVSSDGQQVTRSNGKPATVLAWYRIGMEAEPLQYDKLRNDYTYRITYQITPYLVSNVKSDFFVQSPVQVPHKEYNYWFTGENQEILEYTQDYNYLYYIVTNAKPNQDKITNYQQIEKYVYQPTSGQSDQGAEGGVNEPSANAADYLYSPRDTAQIRIKILGDPAWIQQGELWSGIAGLQFNYDKFLPDGTINYEGREIQFRVNFNKPVDYDLTTGVMDPGQTNFGANRAQGTAGKARESNTYRAITCTSMFSKGAFTQELEGSQIFYSLPGSTSQTSTTAAAQGLTSQADVRRVDNAIEAANRNTDPTVRTTDSTAADGAQINNGAQAYTDPPLESAPDDGVTDANQGTEDSAPTQAQKISPATSDGSDVSVVVPTVPEVTSLPAGVQRDPNSGAFTFTGAAGQENLVAGTNEALAAQVRAINTGNPVTYQDYDRNSGWVTKTFDPQTQTYNIVGPAPDPNQPGVTRAAPQQINREP